jgi:hypothetical protein
MQGAEHRPDPSTLRIRGGGDRPGEGGADGDLVIERRDGHTTVRHIGPHADPGAELAARIEGRAAVAGRVELGGWGITEALHRGATVIIADDVAPGGLVAGPAAWRFGWQRGDWDELGAAVVAGCILDRSRSDTLVEVNADGTVVITPATVDGVIGDLLSGRDASELVEPDATIRLYSVRLAPTETGGVLVHSVRGLPGPATALVEHDEPGGWQASATFAVIGIDPDGIATRVWDAAGGTAEVRFTRRERPRPETWADTVAELRASVVGDDAATAERLLNEVVAGILAADIAGVTRLTTRPPVAWEVTTRSIVEVATTDVDHRLVLDGTTVTIPPAPTQPPPLARRTAPEAVAPPVAAPPARKIAPTVSTHPETIAALRDDLARRRLSAGPADDDSVHWDAQPTTRGALGRLVHACAAPCRRPGGEAVSVAVWVPTADAYDWMQWHLSIERFRTLLPAQAMATVERVELPNLNALAFVIAGRVEMPVALLAEYVRSREVDLPDELYPSSALRTSAT